MTHPNENHSQPTAGYLGVSAQSEPASPHPDYFPPPAAAGQPTVEELAPESIRANRKVLFNLDALENERSAEPFVFEYQGGVFELLDPKDIDWQDLMVAQENPRLMLHVIMPEDQRAAFLQLKLPMRKLEALLGKWQEHFGLPTAGEAEGSARS